MPDVLFASQFHASRAFAMLPSLELYGAPRGASNVADLRVTRYPSNDEVGHIKIYPADTSSKAVSGQPVRIAGD